MQSLSTCWRCRATLPPAMTLPGCTERGQSSGISPAAGSIKAIARVGQLGLACNLIAHLILLPKPSKIKNGMPILGFIIKQHLCICTDHSQVLSVGLSVPPFIFTPPMSFHLWRTVQSIATVSFQHTHTLSISDKSKNHKGLMHSNVSRDPLLLDCVRSSQMR